MKASMIKTIALVTFMFSGIFCANIHADNRYITNEEVRDNQIVSKTVFLNNGSLIRHMKYDFAYDDQARMSQKTAYKWDGRNEEWTPYYQINYSYTDFQVMVEYGQWNKKEQAYTLKKEKSSYEINEQNMPVAYNHQ